MEERDKPIIKYLYLVTNGEIIITSKDKTNNHSLKCVIRE